MSLLLKKVTTFKRSVPVSIPNETGGVDVHPIQVTYRLGVREKGTMTDQEYVHALVVQIEDVGDAQGQEAIDLAAQHDCARPAIVLAYFDAITQDLTGKNSKKSR